jgi:peptidoglycan hydrolase CwlO-like protein
MTSRIPNPPPDSIFSIDLNPCKPFLVDLAPGAMKGMRTAQPGYVAVQTEIVGNQPKYGDRAGITANDFNRFVALNGQHDQIAAQLPAVQKAAEVARESLAHIDDQRHKLATTFANSAERHADAEGNDPTLRTAYEKTIAYRSIIAAKGVSTRKKNEEAKKAGNTAAGANGSAAPATTPAAQGASKEAEPVTRTPSPPPDIIFAIDLNPLKPFLVDLPPGATRGMRTEQEGWDDVVHEIVTSQAKYGDRAGITATDFQRFVALNDQYAQVEAQLPVLEKAEEILTESLAHVDSQRHKLITIFADAVEDHASTEGGDPTLLTAYEKTIAYRGIIADKAAKTRKKNEEAKHQAAPGASGAAGPTGSAAGATGGTGSTAPGGPTG